jgi:murein DD-endopeptidase MepM/ murein hydrolase activator NlpD
VKHRRRAKHRKPGTIKTGRANLVVAGDRVRGGFAHHSRQALAITALVGMGALGLVLVGLDNSPRPVTMLSSDAAQQRQHAADNVDRSVRTEASAGPSTSPAQPSPSPSTKKPEVAKTPKVVKKPGAAKAPEVAKPPKVAKKPATKVQARVPVPKPAVVKKAPSWVVPMAGATVTSCFGQRWGVLHAGIDFAMPSGTPIKAVGAGTVVSAGWAYSGYGISVVVDHHNGYLTHYAHMSQDKVAVGQNVVAGQILGLEGSTGDSTGPHLHFEVHQGMWNQINPAGWLAQRGIKVSC